MDSSQRRVALETVMFGLHCVTDEDKKPLSRLTSDYIRRRTQKLSARDNNVAGGLLWMYSQVNLLYEQDERWSKERIAEALGIRASTAYEHTRQILHTLGPAIYDGRFMRAQAADNSLSCLPTNNPTEKKKQTKDPYELLNMLSGILERQEKMDLTPLTSYLDVLTELLTTTRDGLVQVKQELGQSDAATLRDTAKERIRPLADPVQKELDHLPKKEIQLLLPLIPQGKGDRFFELLRENERIRRIPPHEERKEERINGLISSIQRYKSEISGSLPDEESEPAEVDPTQTIIFKVKLRGRKRIWSKIELQATDTLDTLHHAITMAFDLEPAHLYSFFMDNRIKWPANPANEYTHPAVEDARSAEEAQVGAFGFSQKDKFGYLFDYGDCQQFEIEVVDFGEMHEGTHYPRILDSS